jgi:hypothetical protein
MPLTDEEKEEVVASFTSWVAKNGDTMLDEHYQNDSSRIAAATLMRIGSSARMATPTAARNKSNRFSLRMLPKAPDFFGDDEPEVTNYSVPFQQFRDWFGEVGSIVDRHREVLLRGPLYSLAPAASEEKNNF